MGINAIFSNLNTSTADTTSVKVAAQDKPVSTQDVRAAMKPTTYKKPSKAEIDKIFNIIDRKTGKIPESAGDSPEVAAKNSAIIAKINKLPSDKQKIAEYNRLCPNGNYIVVDKKKCSMTVFESSGKILKTYEVLIGETEGDDLAITRNPDRSKNKNTTVPGEFLIKRNGPYLNIGAANEVQDLSDNLSFVRKGPDGKLVNERFEIFQAIHETWPLYDQYLNNGTLKDNRKTQGCVVLPQAQLDEMQQKYSVGENTHVYVLPEDVGNKLELRKQEGGGIRFINIYKNKEENIKADASRKASGGWYWTNH